MSDIVTKGLGFIELEGRVIERRLAATIFDGVDPTGVLDAVLAYRNPDGGFGHGLEPDKRCPASLPLDVETALDIVGAAGLTTADPRVADIVAGATDWLASVATDEGAVSLCFPVIEQYPRAGHLTEWTYAPALNPTAGLAGRLHGLGVTLPWLDEATRWTWSELDGDLDEDAHSVHEVLIFLEHVPDRHRADQATDKVSAWLDRAAWYRPDPDDPEYGVTPLHLAPTPDSPWRALYDDSLIERHLDRLTRDQRGDGGWTITWEPPSTAATLEWRGIETMRALRTLRAYGRV